MPIANISEVWTNDASQRCPAFIVRKEDNNNNNNNANVSY